MTSRLLGGRYQVGELLGYGGMAEVHRGRDLRLGRDVAIKMLRTDLARDETFQARFRREAQNAASLNHPAIVAVYDTGDERGVNGESQPFIVMEFVNGRTLKELLNAEGRLQPRRALEITADICAALEFSHRHQIIHRDIKPGNVMLTQAGQVKVMDFGIARAMSGHTSTMTQTSAVIGTAQYLSPEQARGETVDARSDVYATGCVLYELITGHPPFTGDNPVSVAYQHVREAPKPPSTLCPDVPPDVDAVVLKALAKNAANRYQSAGEMRADLLRAASGRAVLATPVLAEDERTAVFSPVGGRGVPATVADPGKRKASTWMIVLLIVLGLVAAGALGTGVWLANRKTTIAVPNLVGKKEQDARTELEKQGLRMELGAPVQDETCTVGDVVSQAPAPPGKVDKVGGVVRVQICSGRNQVEVPPLLNLSRDDAVKALAGKKLVAKIVDQDSDKPKDLVYDSDPKPGASVESGSTVTVYVSRGNKGPVPELGGLTEAQARAQLEGLGFTNVEFVPGNPVPGRLPGQVTGTNPKALSVVKKSDNLRVFLQPTTAPTATATPTPTATPT
ncbi:serine/threonine protein kinase [Longispora fulva]|uniref:non-specific serine/threonine protein kinase n=1 Tax=Longispora fulva TaxID=619741 RepID=A0A8J7GK95_9ACTN|nr:Stk1 family PASTA domain-containing Ser/Thr kinase [Longispora fulva]MBG6139721.1 serine/threonine-protein kinase [Longispora fulva]GIG57895.1 serine/threonine protein kinase [Longispora fulva]